MLRLQTRDAGCDSWQSYRSDRPKCLFQCRRCCHVFGRGSRSLGFYAANVLFKVKVGVVTPNLSRPGNTRRQDTAAQGVWRQRCRNGPVRRFAPVDQFFAAGRRCEEVLATVRRRVTSTHRSTAQRQSLQAVAFRKFGLPLRGQRGDTVVRSVRL